MTGTDRRTAPPPDPEAALGESWVANAVSWTAAVRSGGIESRRLATDAVVLAAVLDRAPGRVLDLGCGEGWLVRALAERGVAAVGTDASAPLVEAARAAGGGQGGGDFRVLSYADLAADPGAAGGPSGALFDVVVANFALLGADHGPLLRALGEGALAPGGALVIQTLHPAAAGPPYRDGWRTEDFRGFGGGGAGGVAGGEGGWRPMPWYFRTLGSWLSLLRGAGFALLDIREPVHPATGLPLSLLLVAEPVP
jgi:2-polyprenyl-3-methyl-5-hydroxy-6-metoxy-1,4-benzoquinol methylase